jgi:hypothetical protein
MKRRVFKRAALATVGAAAVTAATALPGSAATTAEWRLSAYESSVTGSMTSVVALSRTDAWAVGNTSRGQTAVNNPYVLHWNGAKWSGVTIPGGNGFTSALVAASSASNVWVLGTNFNGLLNQKIFRYDGSHWHPISVPANANLDTLVVLSATDAWVTGQVSCVGTKCVTDVWQWNGSTWVAHPINSTVFNIAGTSATNVWAVGLSDVNQKNEEGVMAAYRWAGTRWTPVVMSHPEMSGWPVITMSSASNVWIEGWRGTSSQVLALHWTNKWQQVISAAHDAASPDAVPYGSTGVWMGPWEAWTGRSWINAEQHLPFSSGDMQDFAAIPGAPGSYWGAASVTTNANSSVDHPTMVIYGPVP